jgi:hypothetical protein
MAVDVLRMPFASVSCRLYVPYSHSIVQITHSILKFLWNFSAAEQIPTMGPPKSYAFDFKGKITAKIFLWFRQLSASFGRL